MTTPAKRTKIVCTIGPACDTVSAMVALGKAGMNVARLNFSHGTYASHAKLLSRLRKAGRSLDQPFGILQDLQGPKIRVGDLPKEGVKLVDGKPVVFTTSTRPVRGDITVTLPGLHHDVKRGEHLLLDDGLLECIVRRVDGRRIHAEVVHGGTLTSHKGLNLPGTKLRIPALSKKDRADAAWGIAADVDFIALSFIRSPNDVHDLRQILNRTKKGKRIMVVGKIEKQEAIDRFDDILPLLDVVMVARGDLGIETPASKVPVVQKQLIATCRSANVPVIVATQMLDSMQRNPRPTRAEVSDVANAVADHADAVMLSGETATGAYPVDAVRMMADTARATEASPFDDLVPFNVSVERGIPELVGGAVRVASDALDHGTIVVLTSSGRTAREVSAYRPEAMIHAVTNDARVARQLQVSWGIWATVSSTTTSTFEQRAKRAVDLLRRAKRLTRGQRVIVVGGPTPGKSGTANRIEIVTV